MTIKQIDKNFKDFVAFRKLYYSSFPQNERTPYKVLKKAILEYEEFEAFAIYDNRNFVGLCVFTNHSHITNIMFIVIKKEYRNKGFGSKFLEYICNLKKDSVVLADLETPKRKNDNRSRRIKFYQKNGFKASPIQYNWNNEDYIIYAKNGKITEKEFVAFDNYLLNKYNFPYEYI